MDGAALCKASGPMRGLQTGLVLAKGNGR